MVLLPYEDFDDFKKRKSQLTNTEYREGLYELKQEMELRRKKLHELPKNTGPLAYRSNEDRQTVIQSIQLEIDKICQEIIDAVQEVTSPGLVTALEQVLDGELSETILSSPSGNMIKISSY